MGTLIFDFGFIENSLLHGEFLTEVHQSCPGINIEKVTNLHGYKANKIFLSVAVPEDIATVLKLRFGHCIVERPVRNYEKEISEMDMIMQKTRFMKELERQEKESLSKYIIDYDYIDILKKKEDTSMIKKEFYEEMKKLAKFKIGDII